MSFTVNNSLNGLTPLDLDKTKPIKWYICGPTIYDSTHLGHARTYITFDTIRRVLEHYGYTIVYTMNITDLDDKIINKIKEQNDGKIDFDSYHKFISKMEDSFWTTLDKLNVIRPSIVTRVSEYIPKIITYIEKLIDNGYAYVSNRSVYFNYLAFVNNGNNFEPLKGLVPDDDYNSKYVDEKKHKNDFALWKSEKDGEISYSSPWGKGRCGWHIECSTMASDIFGQTLDIHCGGIDLLFPHHNNEIVQTTAFYKTDSWVKYFLHSGHLNIDGLKMSKSLKNFISLDQYFVNNGTANGLRLLCLLHKWDQPLDYSEHTMDEVAFYSKRIDTYIHHIEFIVRDKGIKCIWDSSTEEYFQEVAKFKTLVDASLQNNFDTPTIFRELNIMITKTYTYTENNFNTNIVASFCNYIKGLLTMLGYTFESVTLPKDDQDINNIVQIGVNMREDMRAILKSSSKMVDKQVLTEMYKVLDNCRDGFKEVGIVIEDRGQNRSTKWVHK